MKTASPEMRFIVIKACQAGIPRQQLADIVGYCIIALYLDAYSQLC
jgi:hypothetical protein